MYTYIATYLPIYVYLSTSMLLFYDTELRFSGLLSTPTPPQLQPFGFHLCTSELLSRWKFETTAKEIEIGFFFFMFVNIWNLALGGSENYVRT